MAKLSVYTLYGQGMWLGHHRARVTVQYRAKVTWQHKGNTKLGTVQHKARFTGQQRTRDTWQHRARGVSHRN
eukprot:5076545-Ditylum_brightwellii.AAC.1